MTTVQTEKKIIWAIDPFEETLKSKTQLISTLENLSKAQLAEIEPVHVLSFAREEKLDPWMIQSSPNQFKQAAEKAIHEVVRSLNASHSLSFLPPTVLLQNDHSPAKMAQAIITYATESHASSIVVGTHARSGLPRLFFGSFAENLLLTSHLPIITIGPECVTGHSQKQLLFATDFSSGSRHAFDEVVTFAKSLGMGITLYHVTPHKIEPVVQSAAYLLSGGWIESPDHLTHKEELKQRLALDWESMAKAEGVPVTTVIETAKGNIAELILNYTRTHDLSWIAMAIESGPISTAVMGSLSREVVRNAPSPVWMVRPPEKEI